MQDFQSTLNTVITQPAAVTGNSTNSNRNERR